MRMPKLPRISGKAAIRKLERVGYAVVRQKGSHVRLRSKNSTRKPITVPLHKTLKPGLVARILKDANTTPEEFRKL